MGAYTVGEPLKARYVGITNNYDRRQAEYGSRFEIERVKGLEGNLCRYHARCVEQALIEANGGTRGGQLENANSSISPRSTPARTSCAG